MLAACGSTHFQPYDYEKQEDAEIGLEDFGCSIKLHGKQFYIKRGFGAPEKDGGKAKGK